MSPRLHPSDETLLRFAAGRLAAGPRVVVAAHLAGCPHCRAQVRAFEAIGGALLEAPEPAELAAAAPAPDALARLWARIDGPEAAKATFPVEIPRVPSHRLPPPVPPGLPEGFILPAVLAGCRLGPLRPIAPGVRLGRVRLPDDPTANVMLLRLGHGRRIPDHSHGGVEYTQVLAGSFRDATGRCGPGDLAEADGDVLHAPVVDSQEDCICLVALDGALRFRGLLGVVLRPFL